ncbi:MAG: SufD family Fe-S cluster assembly protein [Alphaproteobacteria bacterium]|nr:SufD family Fe-S cluster assembly protein [Alphaproteobacteria bacterium]
MSSSLSAPAAASDTRSSGLLARLEAIDPTPSRLRAREAFARTGLPHRRIEGWRWSDVRAALSRPPSAGGEATPATPLAGGSGLLFGEDGRVRGELAGASWTRGSPEDEASVPDVGPLGWLAEALAPDGADITLASGAKPLAIVFSGGRGDRFVHLRIRVPQGVEAEVTESHLSGGGFSSVRVDYVLEEGASLHRSVFLAGGAECVQAAVASVRLAPGARFRQTFLSLGAGLSRLETALTHEGDGSEAVLDGAYLLGEGRRTDIVTRVDHLGIGASTRQLVRGAVSSGGRAAFQGRFHVARHAQKTDARMQHQALLLEEGAEVNAKPELEIYADDVQCAHGATTGALDEAALFYMRQRGLPLAQARAILTLSFIASALDSAPPEPREALLGEAERWLTGA